MSPFIITRFMQLSNVNCEEKFSQPPYEIANVKAPIKRARIIEDLCIGCTRCIKACPTDSISGTNKFMHMIIEDQCSGCRFCLDVCPTDCIEMVEQDHPCVEDEIKKLSFYRHRYQRRLKLSRVEPGIQEKIQSRVQAAIVRAAKMVDHINNSRIEIPAGRNSNSE